MVYKETKYPSQGVLDSPRLSKLATVTLKETVKVWFNKRQRANEEVNDSLTSDVVVCKMKSAQ